MVRRLLLVLSVLTLAFPVSALAENPNATDRFQPAPIQGAIDPQLLPSATDDTRTVTIMLQMRGAPVAVVESEAANDELSKAERNRIAAQLKSRQDAITDDIAQRGGRVLSQLQYAYNGIKVQIARNAVPGLADLPEVVAIRGVQKFERNNETSVPFLGVPESVWEDTGFTGAGVKIAVIDTGIDYTHANFGGPGTVEAYQLADANDTTVGDAGDAGLFGPDAPKVKGGIDLVGDAYTGENAPVPDAGPPRLPVHQRERGARVTRVWYRDRSRCECGRLDL